MPPARRRAAGSRRAVGDDAAPEILGTFARPNAPSRPTIVLEIKALDRYPRRAGGGCWCLVNEAKTDMVNDRLTRARRVVSGGFPCYFGPYRPRGFSKEPV